MEQKTESIFWKDFIESNEPIHGNKSGFQSLLAKQINN